MNKVVYYVDALMECYALFHWGNVYEWKYEESLSIESKCYTKVVFNLLYLSSSRNIYFFLSSSSFYFLSESSCLILRKLSLCLLFLASINAIFFLTSKANLFHLSNYFSWFIRSCSYSFFYFFFNSSSYIIQRRSDLSASSASVIRCSSSCFSYSLFLAFFIHSFVNIFILAIICIFRSLYLVCYYFSCSSAFLIFSVSSVANLINS